MNGKTQETRRNWNILKRINNVMIRRFNMNKGMNPKLWHWLETPKPRIKKSENKKGFLSFFKNLFSEVKKAWEV